MRARVARWWLPEEVQVVAELPHNATGKLDKVRLRALFRGHRTPAASDGARSR
jgi:fatty-acyl-CoA synthase